MITQNAKLIAQNDNFKRKSDLRYRSNAFSIEVIRFINTLPHEMAFRIIGDQLLRCATSIGANIIEAKSSSSRRDFIRYYEIALKSANETIYWLGLLRDATRIEPSVINSLLNEVTEISKMLGSSVLTLKNKRF